MYASVLEAYIIKRNDKVFNIVLKFNIITDSILLSWKIKYLWTPLPQQFVACETGYIGLHCKKPCPFPDFGKGCQSSCNCSEDQCNHVKGCLDNGTVMWLYVYIELMIQQVLLF
jgi:hypothetical protein